MVGKRSAGCKVQHPAARAKEGPMSRFASAQQPTEPDYGKSRKPKNKQVAQELYCHLPRELRNHVYKFCIEGSYDNEVIVRRAANANDAIVLLIRERSYQQSYRWIEDPISSSVSAQNLGLDAAREMLESYYWTRTFKFSGRDLSLLVPFLKTDKFGLGMIPASYARRLHIQLQPYIWAQLRLPEARKIEEERCVRTIEAVGLMLTSRTEITIDIDLAEGLKDDMESLAWTERAEKSLLRISQVVKSLKDRGLRVNIIYSRTWDG